MEDFQDLKNRMILAIINKIMDSSSLLEEVDELDIYSKEKGE